MALVLNDRVKETTSTTGQGTISLGGAATGFETFVTGIGNTNTTYYIIAHESDGTWEIGIGTVADASPDTLARTTVIDTSAGNTTKIDFAAGNKTVFCTLPASKAVVLDADGDVTLGANLDVGGNLTVTGLSTLNGGTLTLGDADTDNIVFGGEIDSDIIPDDDGTFDLGSASKEWQDLFIDGTANIDSLVADTADINGGTIDGVTIGGSSAGAITGTTITGTSFVIGSADINETELETIDGVTAGTVAASKAVVVDSNKDISSFRNVTATTFTANTSILPDASGGADIGSSSLEFGDIYIADDKEIKFGNDQDFSIEFDGNFTNLKSVGTEPIRILTDNFIVMNKAGSYNVMNMPTANAGIDFSLNGTRKFSIESFGLDVIDDIHLKDDKKINFGNAQDVSIKYDEANTDTLFITGTVTANDGVVIDNITIDGTEIDLSSGDLTLDVAGDIILDAAGNDIKFNAGGTAIAEFTNSSTDFIIKSVTSDKDMIFKGNDGGSAITALTLDMSAAGLATFNAGVTTGGNIIIPNDGNIGSASDTDAVAISAGGNVTFSQDVIITGSLDVNGTSTTIDTTNLTVADPLVKLSLIHI